MNQRTINKELSFSGKGLQSGKEAKVACMPAAPDTGIVFCRGDLAGRPSFRIGGMAVKNGPERRSTAGFEEVYIQTVEHLMAALWGLGIDNMFIDVSGEELPALDGSALGFLDILTDAGIKHQDAPRNIVKVLEPVKIEEKNASITIIPGGGLEISYTITYDCPSIPDETFSIKLDRDSFRNEIAPARTFCLKKEAEALLKAGLGRGADYQNTLVMDDEGPVGTKLRFPNEPVRHKILDLVGDLYMLGVFIEGKIIAVRSGHRMNAMLVRAIAEKYCVC